MRLLILSLLALPALADEPQFVQVPTDEMKAMYKEYNEMRRQNEVLQDCLGQAIHKIDELESSKNCS